ncbi:MAG: MoaD/ThiS family protein [Deltaproteobacteria bacterium]
MKIEFKLYASLARFMPDQKGGTAANVLEVDEGTTIVDFLDALKVPADAVKLIFLNGVHAQGNEVLKEGDRVGVFPPVAGG